LYVEPGQDVARSDGQGYSGLTIKSCGEGGTRVVAGLYVEPRKDVARSGGQGDSRLTIKSCGEGRTRVVHGLNIQSGKTLPGVAGRVTTFCSTTRNSSTRQTNTRCSTFRLGEGKRRVTWFVHSVRERHCQEWRAG
jgi:hypothetical protein